ncbi:MAG: SGNH/GDSL hydrolase family protein, partial [Cystobacterineae bacterium]|nr:SGNH/GDSL hydrolase family protein [Cystobacterineae bacterium]
LYTHPLPQYMRPLSALFLPLLLPLASTWLACESPKPVSVSLTPFSQEEKQSLNNKRIFFAHQSVGQNILDGLREIGSPLPQRPLHGDTSTAFENPGIVDSLVGENMQPLSKIEHFEKLLMDGVGEHADIAMLKLCYIDFDANTDIEALFQRYEESFQRLRTRFPRLVLVHVTSPLTTVERGAKSWLKKTLGKTLWGILENQKREAFNQKLRQTYAGREPVFDLALAESTYPDGMREFFEHEGTQIPALVAGMSDDGGHLNLAGRAQLASAFARFLAGLSIHSRNMHTDSPPGNSKDIP